MGIAEKISILFAGLFLLVGMLTGVWKYAKIVRSAEHKAPVYVDIAHRNALMFSFASIVIAKLVEYSPFSSTWQIVIIAVPFFFFVMTSVGQITEGFKDRTDNIFKRPDSVRNIFMYGLVAGEIGSVAALLGGFIYTQFFACVYMKGRSLFLILFALAVGSGPVFAQDATRRPTPSPVVTDKQNVTPDNLKGVPVIAPTYQSDERALPDIGRVGVDLLQQRTLTLHEAIELALQNNRDIEVSRKTENIAEFDLRIARAFYQPRLAGQTYYERSTVPNVSIFSTNSTTTQSTILGNAGLQGYVPKFGTILNGTFNNQNISSNNPITILSPQFNSALSFSVTQPLVRGRKFDQPRRTIEIAKRNIDLTDTQFRQRSLETVAGVQRAYWDLTYALRNLQVQQDSVRDAKSQLEHNRRLVNEGQLAPIDIVASDTQVAIFEQAVYDALNVVNFAENVLKGLMSPDRNDGIWSQAITPVEPVEQAIPKDTLPASVAAAVNNRPELEINKVQKDLNQIDQRFYREQKKPQIDLISSYSSSGIGGSQNPNFNNPFGRTVCTIPTSPECQALILQQQTFLSTIGGRASSFTDILANKYPVFRFGVQFNLPLFGDKTAKAQLGKSLVEAERLDVQRQQLEQNIQIEVRNALQAIRSGEARLRAAAVARENTAKQYESEQRKLDNGQSDVYKVLERQTALTSARSSELRARTDLNKSIADYQRSTGESLKANDVVPKLK